MSDDLKDFVIEDFAKQWRIKYDKGQKEHGGVFWEKPAMIANAKDEAKDFVSYIYNIEFQVKYARDLLNAGEQLQALTVLNNLLQTHETDNKLLE